MIPRPVVTIVVLVSLAILTADVGAQIFIPGHKAEPLIDGPLIALIAAVITGAKGPKPDTPSAAAPTSTTPQPTVAPRPEAAGRHHREGPS